MKKGNEEKKLTTRQKDLYNLLEMFPNKWFTPEDIVYGVKGYEWNENAYDNCPAIRRDKIALNNSNEVPHIVVMKNRAFKIATEKEYKRERNAHIRRLKNQVKEIKDMDRKYGLDRQYAYDIDELCCKLIETFKEELIE